MEKQTVGSSTDRWQRPPSRGSGLLPQPSHNQSGPAISPSGIVSGGGGGSKAATTSSHLHAQGQSHHPSTSSSLHHQQHQPTTSTAPPQLLPRKKSVLVCGGAGGGRDEHQHHVMMSPPPGGMNSEQRSQRGGGGQQGGGVPPQSQGTSGDITTATAIVHQHDPDTLESCSRSPLLCLICNKVYEDPRLLSCYHSFCAKCLPGRLGDAKLVCPLCGYVQLLSLLHTYTDPPKVRFIPSNLSPFQKDIRFSFWYPMSIDKAYNNNMGVTPTKLITHRNLYRYVHSIRTYIFSQWDNMQMVFVPNEPCTDDA